jgi:GxxExxY protein
MKLDQHELPHVIAGTCLEVHKHLGPGLDADAYKQCLAHELRMREIVFSADAPLTIRYKGHTISSAAKLDFVIENLMIMSVKSVDELTAAHKEELKNYLRLTGLETGFLVNFNVPHLRSKGIKRIIVSSSAPSLHYTKSELAAGKAKVDDGG